LERGVRSLFQDTIRTGGPTFEITVETKLHKF